MVGWDATTEEEEATGEGMTKGGEGEGVGWKKEGVTRFAAAVTERLSPTGASGAEGDGVGKEGWWCDGVVEAEGGIDGEIVSGWWDRMEIGAAGTALPPMFVAAWKHIIWKKLKTALY